MSKIDDVIKEIRAVIRRRAAEDNSDLYAVIKTLQAAKAEGQRGPGAEKPTGAQETVAGRVESVQPVERPEVDAIRRELYADGSIYRATYRATTDAIKSIRNWQEAMSKRESAQAVEMRLLTDDEEQGFNAECMKCGRKLTSPRDQCCRITVEEFHELMTKDTPNDPR